MKTSLFVKQIQVGPMANFVYLVGDIKNHETFVVDPGWEVEKIIQAAKKDGFKIIGALMTHTHFDHADGLKELLRKTDGTAYIHEKEADFLTDEKLKLKKTKDGDKIQIGEVEIQVIHTPGHTPGSQCFLVDGNLFSGDTLFIQACGRCDLPASNPEDMFYSLKRLSGLDDSTVVYPGHDYADETQSTIGKEKRNNPYMQIQNLDDFLPFRMG